MAWEAKIESQDRIFGLRILYNMYMEEADRMESENLLKEANRLRKWGWEVAKKNPDVFFGRLLEGLDN